MPENRSKRPTFLICEECGHSNTMPDNAQNDPLKDVSDKRLGPHPGTIKRVLNRLKEEMGYGIPDNMGEKDEEEENKSQELQSQGQETAELCAVHAEGYIHAGTT